MAKKELTVVMRARNAMAAGLAKAHRSLQKFGQSAKRIGGLFAKAFAVAGGAVATAGAIFLKAGANAQEMRSKFAAVFKEAAPGAEKFAEDLGKATNRGKNELMGFMSSLQDIFVPMGIGRGEAQKLSGEMTKLALDVASFNNVSDAKVLEDFKSAMTGSNEVLKKYGVVITEASIKSEAYTSGIAKEGEALTEAQKVQARYQLLLKGTRDAQGDAERTAGSLTNQWKGLRGAINDANATIGEAILENGAIADIVGKVREKVVDLTAAFSNWASNGGMERAINTAKLFGKELYSSIKRVLDLRFDAAAIAISAGVAAATIKTVALAKSVKLLNTEIITAIKLLAVKIVRINQMGVSASIAAVKVRALTLSATALSAIGFGALIAGFSGIAYSAIKAEQATRELIKSIEDLQDFRGGIKETYGVSPAVLKQIRQEVEKNIKGEENYLEKLRKVYPEAVRLVEEKMRANKGAEKSAEEAAEAEYSANVSASEAANASAEASILAEKQKKDSIAKRIKELREKRKSAALEYVKTSRRVALEATKADLDSIRERKQAADDLARTRVKALIDERRQQKKINKEIEDEDNHARGLIAKQATGRIKRLSKKDREFLDAWKTINRAKDEAGALGRSEAAKAGEVKKYEDQLKRLDTIATRLQEIKDQNNELLRMG